MKPETRKFLNLYSHLQGAGSTVILFQLIFSTYPLGVATISTNKFGEMVPEIAAFALLSIISVVVAIISLRDYTTKRNEQVA